MSAVTRRRTVLAGNPFPINIEYLVIGGGGSGGDGDGTGAGGGGAGGYRSSVLGESSGGGASAETPITVLEKGETFAISIGGGGAAPAARDVGKDGTDTTFGAITAVGGGGGGEMQVGSGRSGGSGGGEGRRSGGVPGSGTANQGFGGGYGSDDGGGGGGGAGQAGAGATNSNQAGDGGDGVQSSITGTAIYRGGGGGGGGGANVGGISSDGGLGGGSGGVGNRVGFGSEDGEANTGGASGANHLDGPFGQGGSGVVILKYPNTVSLNVGAGLTSTTTELGDFKITEFTAGSDSIEVTS